MKKNFTLLLFLVFSGISALSQRSYDQFSIEVNYGLSQSISPSSSEFSHFDVGVRYMFEEYWGVKVDYASDKFRAELKNNEQGINYNRISVQSVYNLGRLLSLNRITRETFNVLAHAGFGYSFSKSTELPGTDNMGNIILGLTPQIKLGKNFAITADISSIVNIKQHFEFDGYYKHDSPRFNSHFLGTMFNATIGITLYLGENGSDADWK